MNAFEQGLLTYFTSRQLETIAGVTVGIAGAGGLGSNCAAALVRSGFRDFVISDFDVVSPSNLNRQFYFLDQLGRHKVTALAWNLKRINPDVKVETHIEKINNTNINEIYAKCKVMVEAFDNAASKKMLAESFCGKEVLYVTASGLGGWGNSDNIKVRKLNGLFYMVGDQSSEACPACPPCAPRVMITAAKQADCVLEWVLKGGCGTQDAG